MKLQKRKDILSIQEKQKSLTTSSHKEHAIQNVSFSLVKKNLKSIKVKEVRDAMDSEKYATLSQIKLLKDEIHMNAVLSYFVRTEIVAMTNTFAGLDDDMVERICEDIFDDFHYLTVADIKLAFRNGVKGKYGDLKRVDVSVVYGWVNRYNQQRQVIVSKRREEKEKRRKLEISKSAKNTPMPNSLIELANRLKQSSRKTDSKSNSMIGKLREKLSIEK